MSRSRKTNRHTQQQVADKDVAYRCKCSWCESNKRIRIRKEKARTSLKLAEQDSIDSSTDSMDFYYPEKQAYLERHFPPEDNEASAFLYSEVYSQQKIEELLDEWAPQQPLNIAEDQTDTF